MAIYGAGGWSAADERRFADRARAVIDRRLAAPERLREWGRVTLVPRIVVRGSVPRRQVTSQQRRSF